MGYFNSYYGGIDPSTGNPTTAWVDQTNTALCSFYDWQKRTSYQDITLLDCNGGNCPLAVINNGLVLCDPAQSWNCNLCANDLPFWLPAYESDTHHFQFQQLDSINGTLPTGAGLGGWNTGLCNIYVKDCCTDEYLVDLLNNPVSLASLTNDYYIGLYNTPDYRGNPFWRSIQAIEIPLSVWLADFQTQFPTSNCFYYVYVFNKGTLLSPVPDYMYSQPYKIANTCNNTLTIRSSVPDRDCNGYYYHDTDINMYVFSGLTVNGYIPYNNEIRIPGWMERTGFSIKKDFVGVYPKATGSELQYNYKLTTDRIPEALAIYLANIFAGQYIYINDVEFIVDGDINKNNDMGGQWFLEVDLRQVDCSKTFSC